MGMIDQIIDFNKSFVTQEVYEKHLYIFIALFLCSCGNHKTDVATFSDVQFCGDFAAILRRFLSLKVGLKPISWTSFSLNKKPETPLFTGNFRFFLVGCPDGLEPSTFRTTI